MWLRSANASNSYNVYNVNTSGNINNNNAYNARAGVPDCSDSVRWSFRAAGAETGYNAQGAELHAE